MKTITILMIVVILTSVTSMSCKKFNNKAFMRTFVTRYVDTTPHKI